MLLLSDLGKPIRSEHFLAKNKKLIVITVFDSLLTEYIFHIFNVLSSPIAMRTMVVLTASSVDNFCPHC